MKTRYIIALAAAALIFSGCQKNELSDGRGAGVNDGWLKFRLSGLQLTKGTLINSEDEMLEAGVDTFRVQAWNADCSSFVTEQTVTYDTTESKWQTSSPIAWTGSDSKTFFAYTNLPSSGATVTNVCTQSAKKQTLAYTLPLDAREQNDVMLGWYNGNGGGVQTADITFVHPLSSIVLKQGSMDVTGIKCITVSGLYASGTVDVTYAVVDDEVVPTYDWGATDTRTGSVVSTLTPAEGAQYISVGEDGIIGTPFIVIPQTVAANQVKITVTASIAGADKNLVVNVPAGAFVAGETHVFTLGYSNPDLLTGKFSVSATEYVKFSKGNLFCIRSGSVGSYTYSFGLESNQYDFRTRPGNYAVKNGIPMDTGTGSDESGLFQYDLSCAVDGGDFGAFGTNYPIVGDPSQIMNFGKAIGPEWYTLTQSEWIYLLNEHVSVWCKVKGIYGYAFAPDGYDTTTQPWTTTGNELSNWKEAESAGVLFIPAAGFMQGEGENFGTVYADGSDVPFSGYSWTSTADGAEGALYMGFGETVIGTFNHVNSFAFPERLVQKFDKPH